MLDNIRRKLSHQKYKVFYDKVWNLGIFEDLVYYNDVGYPLPIVRAMKKASGKSFRYIYKTSKSVKLKGVSFAMLECPKGTFIMGHKEQEDNPPRTEVIDAPFLLGQTEVTQELYQAMMGTNPSSYKNPQNPVEKVSWGDAIKFCNRLSELQGLDKCYTKNSSEEYDWLCDSKKNGYRLPTEKEWEYASKAGTENEWSGTDDEKKLKKYAVYWDNSNESTEPVGSKAPNEWGFYDMSGNVGEWCWDKYDPEGDASALRVNRGGGWSNNAPDLRSANRRPEEAGSRDGLLGFRICRTFV